MVTMPKKLNLNSKKLLTSKYFLEKILMTDFLNLFFKKIYQK